MEKSTNIQNEEIREIAKRKVQKIKNFYIHTLVFFIALLAYVLKTYGIAELPFFPFKFLNSFAMAIWGFIWFCDATDLLVLTFVIGKKWEQRQIERHIKNESKKNFYK